MRNISMQILLTSKLAFFIRCLMKKGELTAFEAGLKFPCKPILVVSNRKGILLTVKIAAAVGYCYYTG